jgi:hypothetical protein
MGNKALLLALASSTLLGCYGPLVADPATDGAADPFATAPLPAESQLEDLSAGEAFASLSDQTGVPADLLAALAWVGSSFAPIEHDGEHCSPTHGWLGLNADQLARAAELTGFSIDHIEADREANLIAGAALLRELRSSVAPDATDGEADASWWPVVVAWPGFDEAWLNHEFAFDVFATLQRGLYASTIDGDMVEIVARDMPGLADVDFIYPPSGDGTSFAAGTDYPGAARWLPAHSSNWSSRSGGTGAIQRVVIHTTEGMYDGAISWFRNPSSDVSAHYVVRRSDGHITQMVRDRDRAWHAAGANADTIGIEHEGAAASASTWTTAILESSARLTAWLTLQYDIPVDRSHIVAHSEVTSYKVDPGPHFPWDQYLALVNCYRGDSSGTCAGGVIADLPGPDEGGGATTSPGGGSAGGGSTGGGSTGGGSTGGGSTGGGSSGGGATAGTPWVEWVAPRDGDVVPNPVTMWARHDGQANFMEFWQGPWRLGPDVMENPGNRAITFSQPGNKTLRVVAKSATGATLATDSVSVIVQNGASHVQVGGQALGGLTWRIDANVASDEAEYVQFYVDGDLLTEDGTGHNRAVGPEFSMEYTFSQTGAGRVLVGRAYDADGHFLGEGTTILDVQEDSAPECGIVGQIGCGTTVSGDTSLNGTRAHGGYPDIVGNWDGPELGYSWSSTISGEVEIRFVDPESTVTDLDIIVLARNYGECVSADATGEIAFTSLRFEAEAGTQYVFVVDGYDGAAGAFTIELDCAPE